MVGCSERYYMLLGLVYVYIYGSICSLGNNANSTVNLVSDNYL